MGNSSSGSGVGILTVLGVIFVVLKLIPTGDPGKHQHLINWSWWWVLAPFWMPLVLLAAVLLVVFVGFLIYRAVKK